MSNFPSWFYTSDAHKNFINNTKIFAEKESSILQIGAYTGEASLWIAENLLMHPNSTLTDVDTWEGSKEEVHKNFVWSEVEKEYNLKVSKYLNNKKINKFKGTSDDFFKSNIKLYDLIYIDGDHRSLPVLKDAIAAFSFLNVGGIIAFDDYLWKEEPKSILTPKPAIDSFLNIFKDYITIIHHGYQIWVVKNLHIDLKEILG